MKQVLIPTKLDGIASKLLEASGFEVVQDADTPLPELAERHPETSALIVRSDKIGPGIIDALPRLKVIVRAGSGTDSIDVKHCRRQGVDVMNTPGANANAVAEEVVAMMLAHSRHLIRGDASTRAGEWEKKALMGHEITGKTVGIVGLGNIGQLVARRLEGFECRVLGYDPVLSRARAEEIGIELVSLADVFSQSDFVTLHVPETPETAGMVGAELIGMMKPGATLVNCARAGIVDESALRAARQEKPLGFCNDVYDKDGPGPKSCADIADLMLPHLGASTHEANQNAARRAAEQLIAYVERGVTTYVVNKGVPDGLDEGFQQLAYQVAFIARCLLGAGQPIRSVSCSFYGGLGDFVRWLLPSVAAGLSAEYNPLEDMADPEEYLAGKGISLEVRTPDESKGYGKSMTIDLIQGREALRQVSVRGTLAEGNPVISRINDFDKLYFQPQGHSLMVEYVDRPGMLAKITAACAERDINIEDIRAPRDPSATRALAVLKTNRAVPAEALEGLRADTGSEMVVAISLP